MALCQPVWPVSHWIGDGLVILAMVIWGLLTLAFISRLLRFPHSVLAEIRHPVMSSFVSLFPANDAGRDWFCPVVSTAGDCVVQHWRGDTAGHTQPGKRLDYGVGSIRKRPPRRVCICQPLPITLSAPWPVVHLGSTMPGWCFGRRGYFPGSASSR